jgi:hemerythrin
METLRSEFCSWDPPQYSIRVPAMDSEREILIGYTRKYFADEEAHRLQIDFPGRRVHGVMHKQLLARVSRSSTRLDVH